MIHRQTGSPWFLCAVFALALALCIGCPEDETQDDDDSAAGDDDAADDDTGDDDTGDDDTGDDDTGDDDVAGDPDIAATPPALNFGTVGVGNSATIPLEIANVGTGPLEIFEMVCPLPAISFTPFTGVIPPGSAETVPVTGTCTVEEEVGGMLVIASDDPDENPLQIQVILICDEA